MYKDVCIYNAGRAVHRSDWNFILPGSIFWRLYRVVKGKAIVRIYEREFEIKSGYLYLIPAYRDHQDILDGSLQLDYIHFKLDDGFSNEMFENVDMPFEIESSDFNEAAMQRICELCSGFELSSPEPGDYEKNSNYIFWTQRYESLPLPAKLEIEGLIKVLLSAFLSKSVKRMISNNPRLAKGKKIIDQNITYKIDISNIATLVGMRPESFIRAFHKEYGVSPVHYVLEARINMAKRLLLITVLSIKEIANRCGFSNPSYFCKIFKKFAFVSPGEYRKGSFQIKDSVISSKY